MALERRAFFVEQAKSGAVFEASLTMIIRGIGSSPNGRVPEPSHGSISFSKLGFGVTPHVGNAGGHALATATAVATSLSISRPATGRT